jgi:DedD protein
MKWAFWRREPATSPGADTRTAARSRAADDDAPRTDPAAELRVRARRRLIGAAALLLAAVVLVPMVLDPAPRPVADTVPIDIPSEKTPFTPRLSLPRVPEPANVPMAPPDVSPAPESGKGDSEGKGATSAKGDTKGEARSDAKAEAKGDAKAEPKPTDAKTTADAQRARDILEGKAAADKKGKFIVQAAALASESAAGELAARLKKGGLAPYTERVQTQDGVRWRVRVGPYVTRDDAEKARARLRALDVNATVVSG